MPLPPGFTTPPLLGADMKIPFVWRGEQAVVSQHFGDLGDEGVEQQWHQARRLMQAVYGFTPQSGGQRCASGLPFDAVGGLVWRCRLSVLHHHAHATAWRNDGWPLDGGDVIAVVPRRYRHGENGALWGGECLRVNYYRQCERLGGLPAVAPRRRSGGSSTVA